MKKLTLFLLLTANCYLLTAPMARGAIEIKKAQPVAAAQTQTGVGGLLAGNSLIPTALGLVGNVMSLSQQQAALVGECEPTDSEVNFVRNLMQEWARAGGAAPVLGGRAACSGSMNYATFVRTYPADMAACFNVFNGSQDSWQIYANYPYPGKGIRLKDPTGPNNAKNQVVLSDIYEMFAAIGFEDADYLPTEVAQVARLKEKAVKCNPAVLSAKQRELWGNMLVQTVGGLGQNQNAGATMGQVGAILQSGGGSPLGSVVGALPILTGTLLNQ
jgi:hypothetical protein